MATKAAIHRKSDQNINGDAYTNSFQVVKLFLHCLDGTYRKMTLPSSRAWMVGRTWRRRLRCRLPASGSGIAP